MIFANFLYLITSYNVFLHNSQARCVPTRSDVIYCIVAMATTRHAEQPGALLHHIIWQSAKSHMSEHFRSEPCYFSTYQKSKI